MASTHHRLGRGVTGEAPLASGRDADVFVIDSQRVLRRYRDGGDVTSEAAFMAYAAELGYPVPHVYAATGTDLVLEHLDGPTMTQALGAGDFDVQAGGVLLADLHGRLHALPPRLSTDAHDRILHLDLHPDNVMLTSRGPVVIDWRNATDGPADLDLALSALILAQVAVDDQQGMAAGADLLLTAFLQHAGGDPLRMLDRAVEIRRADPGLTADEVGLLAAAANRLRLRRPDTV